MRWSTHDKVSWRYTKKYSEDSTQLTYLRSRYYSSGTGRFLTRDAWGGDENIPMSYNRWLYTYAQPISNTDPSGLQTYDHMIFATFKDDYDDQHKTAPRWTNQKMNAVNQALTTIAIAYANAYNSELARMGSIDECDTLYELYIDASTPKIDPFSAFFRVHGGKVPFYLRPESPGWWGELHTEKDKPHTVYIYASTNWNYLLGTKEYLDRFITHEMGHVFERAYTDALHTSAFPLATAMNRAGITDRVGFAGRFLEWQWSDRDLNYEIFADMYVGWVFNSWARKPSVGEQNYNSNLHIYEEGFKKSSFMDTNMPKWVTEMIFGTYRP